jgi:carbon monoxide dehydrogenase subunit G
MQFDNFFSIEAPIDDVYATIADVARVVPCVPGAALLEQQGDDVFEVSLKAELGPLWKNFLGTITVVERDAAAHRLVLTNSAREADGDPVGDATIEIGLAELGAHTNVSISTQSTLDEGMFAEKLVGDAAEKQMAEFAENLQAMIATAPRAV